MTYRVRFILLVILFVVTGLIGGWTLASYNRSFIESWAAGLAHAILFFIILNLWVNKGK